MALIMGVSVPDGHAVMPKTGETKLSIKEVGGHVWLVDQDGLQVQGVTSLQAKTEVNCTTRLIIECISHDLSVK